MFTCNSKKVVKACQSWSIRLQAAEAYGRSRFSLPEVTRLGLLFADGW